MKIRIRTGVPAPVRIGIVGAVVIVLLLGAVAPGHTAMAPTGTGTSTLSITPAALDITGLPVDVEASLGILLADATNTAVPVARLALANLGAGGLTAPDIGLSSADGDTSGGESRTVAANGVSATVELVDYLVEAGADSAAAELSALAAQIETPIGLSPEVQAQGLRVSADPTGTASSIVLQVSGLTVGLADLLPADVLDALPFSVVLDLIDSLDLPLTTDLLDQIADVDALLLALTAAVEQAQVVAALQAELDAAAVGLPEADAVNLAQQALDDAELAVQLLEAEAAQLTLDIAGLEAEIEALETELAGLLLLDPLDLLRIDAINLELDALEAELALLEAELEAIETTELPAAIAEVDAALVILADAEQALEEALIELGLEALLAELALAEGLLGDLLQQLDALLDGLDLAALPDALLGALAGTPLLDLGSIGLALATSADATSSLGAVTCTAAALRVLGAPVPTPDCDAVGIALDSLARAITDALSVLPVAAPVPVVTTGGLDTSSSGAGVPDAEGASTAFARVSALTLEIASVDLVATTDALVDELAVLVGELDALLLGLDGGIASLQVSEDSFQALVLDVPLDLEANLDDLQGTLAALPTGDALGGLRTVGLGAALGTIELESSFTSSSAGAPGSPFAPGTPAAPDSPVAPDAPAPPESPRTPEAPLAPAAPAPPGSATPIAPVPVAPGVPSPPTGVPGGSLPRTGTELHLLWAAALAAVAAGGVAVALGRGVSGGTLAAPGRR